MANTKSPLISYKGKPAEYWISVLERMEQEHQANHDRWWNTDEGFRLREDGSRSERKWFYRVDSTCECECSDAQKHSENTKDLRAKVYPSSTSRYLRAYNAGQLPDYEY